jgi:hypothetical protein
MEIFAEEIARALVLEERFMKQQAAITAQLLSEKE